MAIKIMSGILVTRDHPTGTATIHFDEHEVTGTLGRAHKTRTIGPSGSFSSPPCKMVALLEIGFRESGEGRTRFPRSYSFNIDDTRLTEDFLEIRWEGVNGRIEEISYLIIGEAPD